MQRKLKSPKCPKCPSDARIASRLRCRAVHVHECDACTVVKYHKRGLTQKHKSFAHKTDWVRRHPHLLRLLSRFLWLAQARRETEVSGPEALRVLFH